MITIKVSYRWAISRAYSNMMANKYDAMVDDNNVNIYNRAHDPIIIFNASKALKTVGDAKAVPVSEIEENMDTVRTELNKYGEYLKL